MDEGNVFVGPAVVVDDKVDDRSAGMTVVIDQIEDAGIPVFRRTELPPDNEVRHWRGFALVILDWELVSSGEAGVGLPDSLREQNASDVAKFVQTLLTDLYCPIFILSNQDVEGIRSELAQRLNVQSQQVAARVLVRSKGSVAEGLIADLEGWVRSQAAVYALKTWEYGYYDACRQMFSDFELSSGDWPRILWETSEKDKTNPHFELAETIGRNILHRFEPLVFDEDALLTGEALKSASALRSVVHRRAVVPAESLHGDVAMPGDFFWASDAAGSEDGAKDLLINVTPACDLVPRSNGDGDIRMTVLRAHALPATAWSSKTQRKKLRKDHDPTSEVVWVLRPDGHPYRVMFKEWFVVGWLDHQPRRLGRLIEPYITHLQQRFALHFHRQGLPRLPELFHEMDTSE